MKILLAILIVVVTAAAVACGSENAGGEPTSVSTPTPGINGQNSETPAITPTPAGPLTPTPLSDELAEQQALLNAARDRWSLHRPESYEFTFAWSCFCMPHITQEVRIQVDGGRVTRVVATESGQEVTFNPVFHLAVDELLDWVQLQIDRRVASLSVEYERDLAYPVSASLDTVLNAVDDEQSFRVSNFRPGTGSIDLSELEHQLNAAESLWFDRGLQNYMYETWWECFCPPAYSAPVVVRVQTGQVISVTNIETGEEHTVPGDSPYRTVEQLFAWTRQQLDRSPEFMALEFDPENGFPLKAQVDPIVNLFDDENAFFARDLQELDAHAETRKRLNDARSLWASQGLTNYSYRFNWSCFCGPEYTQEVAIRVIGGVVDSVLVASDGMPVRDDYFMQFLTVDGLFDKVEDAIELDAASITAEFDEATGYPVSASIDYYYNIADDEISFQVHTLSPVGG